MSLWDDAVDLPVGRDGVAENAGYIGGRVQAERWHALGYDIADAIDRYRGFLHKWESYRSEKRADAYCLAWFAAEYKRAVDLGIPHDDPDLWRIKSAPKYHDAYKTAPQVPRLKSMTPDDPLPLWARLTASETGARKS